MPRAKAKRVETDESAEKKKTGRPRKAISQKQFEELCSIQCTEEEIMAVLDVSDKTLTKWCMETYGKSFSEVFRIKRQGGKTSLRRKQWKLAEKNAPMAIFLGKNYLGQSDERKIDIGGQLGINPFAGLTEEELRRLAQDDE